MNRNKILLLAGTGAIGRWLSQILTEAGNDVYVTTRQIGRIQRGVKFLCGDCKSVSVLRQFINGVRPNVIVDFFSYSTKEFAERFELLLSSTQHYLFLSSYRVFSDDCPLSEKSPRILDTDYSKKDFAIDDYPLEKARQENILRASRFNNWTIIRPAITYSEDRFQLGCMESEVVCYRALQGVPVAMPKAMRDIETTLTYGKDVARLISRLVLNPAAYGEDYNCASASHLKWGDVCHIFEDAIGARVSDIDIGDYVNFCSSPAQVFHDRMVNRVIDNRKVLDATGLRQTEFVLAKVGLREALCAFKQHPHYRSIFYWEQGHLDRILHSRICLKDASKSEVFQYLCALYPHLQQPLTACRRLCSRARCLLKGHF